jgi:hypothetical protein
MMMIDSLSDCCILASIGKGTVDLFFGVSSCVCDAPGTC